MNQLGTRHLLCLLISVILRISVVPHPQTIPARRYRLETTTLDRLRVPFDPIALDKILSTRTEGFVPSPSFWHGWISGNYRYERESLLSAPTSKKTHLSEDGKYHQW